MLKNSPAQLASYLHRIWIEEREQGRYVIKQLNPSFVTTSGQRKNYNLREQIAQEWAEVGLPFIPAYFFADEALLDQDGHYYLVHPWIEGKTLTDLDIMPHHAQQIGKLLAQLHSVSLQLARDQKLRPPLNLTTNQPFWLDLFIKAAELVPDLNKILVESMDYIFQVLQQLPAAQALLSNKQVLSHRDLTPSNVLWQADVQFHIIDHEWVGWIHPEVDLLTTALDWSLSSKALWDPALFKAVLQGYQQQAKVGLQVDLEILWLLVLVHWCSWLEFNLQRIVGRSFAFGSREKSIQEVMYTLEAIKTVRAQFESLRKIWTSDPS